MSRDASLTDFGREDGESDEAAARDDSDPDPGATTEPASASEPSARTPADGEDEDGGSTAGSGDPIDGEGQPSAVTTTFAVASDDRPCEHCGQGTGRRWRHEGKLVCGDCKEW